jgi:tetratricopeptide (TPR) repeat protein
MLDFNEELAKFQPCADLEEAEENIYGKELEEIKKNKTELYKANQMIKKYNQALNYAKQGNDDLAMLQLKNVVAAIPNFVDAYLLMALLSIKGENYDNARTFLDTILKIDPNNESAVEYGKEFETKVVEEEPQTTEPEKKDKKKKEKKKVVSQPEEPKKKKNPFNISSIQENEAGKSPMFYMVTGIVIGVIVAAVLIYPTVRASFSHKNSTQVEDYKEQILAKDTQLKASEKKVKEAKAAQKKAEDELDEYIGTSKKDGVYDLLLSALQKYSDRDYTGSADALLDIDSQKLTTKNMKAIYKDLTAKVYPSAGTGLYSKGKNAYWATRQRSLI